MGLFSRKQKNIKKQKSWREEKFKAQSSYLKKKKQKNTKLSRFLFWILLLAFLGICTYLLFFSTFLDMDNILIQGNSEITSTEISSRIEKSLEGKAFYIFSSKNYFFVNRKNIDTALRNNFNHLETSSIEKKFPKTLIVSVIERKAEIVWCSAGVCYLTGEDGLVYDGAASGETEMRNAGYVVVVDDRARAVEIGKTEIRPEFIRFIEEIDKMLRENLEITVADSFHTPEAASGEVNVKTSEGLTLKLSSLFPIEETEKMIRTLFDKELNPDQRKNLDYLDLRVRNKAYYKIKQEEGDGQAE